MTSWETTKVVYQPIVVKYENVVGSPKHVQQRVERLLREGWQPNSELLPFTPEGRQTGLFVQSMVVRKIPKHD